MAEIKSKLWNGRKVKEEKVFDSRTLAETWLKENGYSVGRMSRDNPIGVYKGDADIAKWHNLSKSDKAMLDGVITSMDWRTDAKVILFEEKTVL
jgi:hypothetical protein